MQTSGAVYAQIEKVKAFVNVNLVPMTKEKIISSQTVLIKGKQIIAIGPSKHIDIPDNSEIINGTNAYLMPGLADMHIHTDTRWLNGWPVSPLYLFLANGVTTIRDFGPKGTPVDYALNWRDDIEQGERQGPTFYGAGPILYGPVGDAGKIVQAQKFQGFDFVKLYSFLSEKEFHDAITTAKNLNMYTAGHIPFAIGLDSVLSKGMNEIAHIEELDFEFLDFDRSQSLGHEEWFRYLLDVATDEFGNSPDLDIADLKKRYQTHIKDIVNRLKTANVPICTTLAVGEIIVQKLFHMHNLVSRSTSQYLPYGYIALLKQGKERHQIQWKGHENFAPVHYKLNQLLLRELHKGGVPLVLGTDAGPFGMGLVPGFSIHDELRILTENGFTPYEAIKTGTVNAAEVIQNMIGKGDFGTVEVGKRADLILIGGNPFDDIDNIRKLHGVMASGRWYDKATLQKMITSGIPVAGAVHHVYEPDKSHNTYIDIIILKNYAGKLPDAIESITVTGPKGNLPIRKDDFTYIPQLRDFWIRIPGSPEIGTYTFEVASDKKTGSAEDNQSVLTTIPTPDINTFSPSNDATLHSNTPTFSWVAVKAEIPVYYRLEINQQHGGRVYSTGHVEGMLSHTIPDGILKSGQAYRWRIRVTDSDNWVKIQNRSHSGWQSFTMVKTLEYDYQVPDKEDDGWETSSLNEEGIDSEKINELMHKIINRNIKNIHSVLLVKNGKLVLEEYFYGYNKDTKHQMRSATKSVVSILIGLAIDQNNLQDVDMMVYEFFPEYKGTKWIDQQYEITLKHLLTMTAGLEWDEWSYPDYDERSSYYKTFHGTDNWVKPIFNLNLIKPPSEQFTYNSTLTHLLGEITKKATGTQTDKFAEEYLFTPLGISDYSWPRHPDGSLWAAGGLSLKPRDMAKIGYLFLRNGKWNGKKIVSPDWISESTRAHVKAYFGGSKYGYQWWCGNTVIGNQTIHTYYASGRGGQYIFVIPILDLVVVFTSQVLNNSPEGIFRPQVMMAEYIIPANLPQSVPQKTIKLAPIVFEKYVGEYYFKMWNEKVSVVKDADKIYLMAPDGEKVELSPLTEYQFHGTLKDIGDIKINFHKNEKGEITNLNFIIGFSHLPCDKLK